MRTKRFFALLLTICMIGGLIPTVFAAEGEATTTTLVYDFTSTALIKPDGTPNINTVKVSNTPTVGYAAINTYTLDRTKSTGYWKFEQLINVDAAPFQYNGLRFKTSRSGITDNNNAVVFTINVPSSGTYTASVSDYKNYFTNEWTDIYMVSKDVVKAKGWDVTTIAGVKSAIEVSSMTDSTASVKHIASYDACFDATGDNDELAENVFLFAGDYYMFVVASDSSTAPSSGTEDTGYVWGMLSKLTLTSEDASAASADVTYSFIATAQAGNTGDTVDFNLIRYNNSLNREISTGFWKYCDVIRMDLNKMYPEANGGGIFRVNDKSNLGNNAIVLAASLDNSGTYKPSMVYRQSTQCGRLNIYFVPVSYADSKWTSTISSWNLAEIFGDFGVKRIVSQDGYSSTAANDVPGEYNNVYLDSGNYYVLISLAPGAAETENGDGYTFFYTKGLTLTRQPEISLSAPSSTLKIGKTATLSTVLTNEAGNPITVGSFAYESSDTSIATVDAQSGVVRGVAEGEATIKVTATVCGVEFTDSVDITVEPELEYVALATANNVEENSFKIIGDKYTRGNMVTASAAQELNVGGTTYVFRHWVRGTADNGEVVSKSASYSFPLMTNTYLTAIYSEETTDKIVEFYNGNGDYLETKTVVNNAVELPETPVLTGFKFLQWIVGKNGNESIVLDKANVTADVTYAVAEFGDDAAVTFTVDGEDNALVYDAPVTRNSFDGEEKAWYRNGALVGYGTSYTFNVWADVTSIEEKEITTKAPVVYLDPVAKDSARMIEYDAGGKEIVEVGILFGNGNNMSVASCMYKATSQENGGEDGHGQFTAKPANDSYTTARGYMIYLDGSEYKVVYSD